MNVALLNIAELKNDCSLPNNEFGCSLSALSALNGTELVILDEDGYLALLEANFPDDGDVFGIDWEKYDYVSIATSDENGVPTDLYSFRKNWLIVISEH